MRQLLAGLTILVILSGAVNAAPPTAAREPVERLSETLLETMKAADRLDVAARRDKLAPVLREVFDFGFMTRLATGGHWRRLSERHRARLVDRFAGMSIATYAARFDGYAGHRFEIGEASEGPGASVRVPTQLVKADGERVAIDYLVRRASDESTWQIVDVYLNGRYSELATRRSEYTSVLKNEGYDALIDRLNARIDRLTAEDQSG